MVRASMGHLRDLPKSQFGIDIENDFAPKFINIRGKGELIKGWDEGIPGHAVGSRLLVIVPPADGYGKQGREPDIKGDDTLVFVLDILDAR